MSNRTLVKVSASENCIGFRTISRNRKSRQRYLVTRDQLARLEYEPQIITRDIFSFAVLRRDSNAGTLSIDFSWLNGSSGGKLMGWEETVTLSYDALTDFVQASTQEDGPQQWKTLSIEKVTTPQIVFVDKPRLSECLENKVVRKKLARALRDNFRCDDRVEFYHDFMAYSFMFKAFRSGWSPLIGGLIFHNHKDNLKKAYYSVHT